MSNGGKEILFCIALCALFFSFCSVAHAQKPKKLARIGYLSAQEAAIESDRSNAIRQALRELGYIEGQNIVFEYRYGDSKIERYPELAAQLVRLNVDVIVAAGGDVLVGSVANATKTIPIVMAGQGLNSVDAGYVESLAHPGGNVTGITLLFRELGGKRLEFFREAIPKLSRVGFLYDPAIPGSVREIKDALPAAARALHLSIQPWKVRNADEFEKVFAALNKDRPDGLYVSGGPFLRSNEKRIAEFVLKSRLPSVHDRRGAVDAGGLMSYGPDVAGSYQRVAYYVDKILKGAKPADLPVEQPTKFELVINLKTAKQIGVTIPQSVLYKADRVIK
jgi:ABC-type uncharacterized transport system substrate-binding protein